MTIVVSLLRQAQKEELTCLVQLWVHWVEEAVEEEVEAVAVVAVQHSSQHHLSISLTTIEA